MSGGYRTFKVDGIEKIFIEISSADPSTPGLVAVSDDLPVPINDQGSAGTADEVSRADHVHAEPAPWDTIDTTDAVQTHMLVPLVDSDDVSQVAAIDLLMVAWSDDGGTDAFTMQLSADYLGSANPGGGNTFTLINAVTGGREAFGAPVANATAGAGGWSATIVLNVDSLPVPAVVGDANRVVHWAVYKRVRRF